MTYLGVMFDTEAMTMRVPPDKLVEIKVEINSWARKTTSTQRDMQSQNVLTQGYRFAQSTRKGLISHLRTWFFFALYFGFSTMPATEDSLCMFLELLSLTCGYAHCKAVLSTVKYLHAALGYTTRSLLIVLSRDSSGGYPGLHSRSCQSTQQS